MFPEGLVTPLLLIALVTVVGACVEDSDWSRLVIPVSLVGFMAALFGSVIAKLRVLDSIAHMLSIVLGIGCSFFLVARNAAGLEGGLQHRIREIGTVGLDWYMGENVGRDMEALLVSLLMGVIVWLVGYLAAWSLFRRGWIFAAVALPGFLMLVNLGYADVPQTGWLAAFAFLALVLFARFSLYTRQREWRRHRLAGPSGMASRFLVTGVVVALIATSIGWRSPTSFSQEAFQPLVGEVSSRALSAQDTARDWLQDVTGTTPTGTSVSGSYTEFGESFSVGGPLELSDQPQVLVYSDYAPYLTAQHYDSYSGRGWFSTTEETFDPNGPDGRRYSPEMTFVANQDVPLSSNVDQGRTSMAIEVEPLAPMGDRVLTVDTHQSSSVESSVRMSWIQLEDAVFEVDAFTVATLPRDIQPLAVMLLGAELSGEQTTAGPGASDPALQAEIDAERQNLVSRFLEVAWEAQDGDIQTITVNGQIPVYDDVEAVFSNDPDVIDGRYRVVAATSQANVGDLQGAGGDYPEWVLDRYLSLPESITPRTVELTQTITSAADNPYDQARAIEQYLRSSITYDENVEAPPEGADVVDYLLFERERGYCEYSASAMTVMLRSIGIPARVAVGFYPGDYDEAQEGYVYLQANAHAWTEVFFPGYGWIPFEPTSSQPVRDLEQYQGDDSMQPESTPLPVEETPEPTTPASASTPIGDNQEQPPIAPQVTPESGGGGPNWTLIGGMAALAALAIAALAWFAWALPLRGLSPASAIYSRFRRVGRWLGVRPAENATPREFGDAFLERVPQSQPQVERIVQMYELDQFGPDGADSGWLNSAERAWDSLKRQLPGRLLPWKRSGTRKSG